MAKCSRTDTGISLIGETEWGTNICLFYETEKDLLETTAGYFKAGLLNNELCVWNVSEPVTIACAEAAMRREVPNFQDFAEAGQILINSDEKWELQDDEFNLQRIAGGWAETLKRALERGYEGLRISGNASWLETNHWKEFCEYDLELDRCVAGKQIILLCTHLFTKKRMIEDIDIVRAHHFTVCRRQDVWKFVDTLQLERVTEELRKLASGEQAFPGAEELTHREKAVLVHIVQGGSSKEIGRELGISPRTIEFHRANIMSKIGAKNVADLVRIMVEKS